MRSVGVPIHMITRRQALYPRVGQKECEEEGHDEQGEHVEIGLQNCIDILSKVKEHTS